MNNQVFETYFNERMLLLKMINIQIISIEIVESEKYRERNKKEKEFIELSFLNQYIDGGYIDHLILDLQQYLIFYLQFFLTAIYNGANLIIETEDQIVEQAKVDPFFNKDNLDKWRYEKQKQI